MTDTAQPDVNLPAPPAVPPEQLEHARQELEKLTPEAYLELLKYIKTLEDNATLGEAGGICFTRLYGQNGGEVNITARGVTAKDAIDGLFDGVSYIMNWQSHFGWSPSRQKAPPAPAQTTQNQPPPASTQPPPPPSQPAPAQAQTSDPQEPQYVPVGDQMVIEKFQVAAVTRQISKTGKNFLNVKTVERAFSDYGVSAWEEVVPVDFTTWDVGAPFGPPEGMQYANINTVKPKKVISFSAT